MRPSPDQLFTGPRLPTAVPHGTGAWGSIVAADLPADVVYTVAMTSAIDAAGLRDNYLDLERRFRALLVAYTLFVNAPPPGLETEFAIALAAQ